MQQSINEKYRDGSDIDSGSEEPNSEYDEP